MPSRIPLVIHAAKKWIIIHKRIEALVVVFLPICLVRKKKVHTFAAQYRDVLPAKVHLVVLNWERECESPTVPQL